MIIDDDNLDITIQLTKDDVDEMYAGLFNIESICNTCGKHTFCKDDRQTDYITDGCICYTCCMIRNKEGL